MKITIEGGDLHNLTIHLEKETDVLEIHTAKVMNCTITGSGQVLLRNCPNIQNLHVNEKKESDK